MRSDALRRRENILRAARELFAEHGAQIAMETIAEASGVGIGTLYRNFADRNALVEEVTLGTLGDIRIASQSAVQRLEDGDTDAWEVLLGTLVQQNLGALSEALGLQLPKKISPRILEVQAEAGQSLHSALDLAKNANLVRKDVTEIELIATIGAMTRPLPRAFSKSQPGLEDRIVQIMRDGLRPQTTQD
ncbi:MULTISPECIES: helix-turn-helix domain-containing protein [Actinomycetes]|uniref:helix-turn-helix domain-containing protein n=2 Tax=Actinomycetota TaxID=201174 RepID=UPI000FB6C88F